MHGRGRDLGRVASLGGGVGRVELPLVAFEGKELREASWREVWRGKTLG